ncbi:hypothetical protein [Streptomyces sp. NPDC051994]|uniref:hypothetical protein n=1 Tax=unclassified Streptomyces TaxID=2593676 RepID=UPI0034475413
MWLRKTRLIPGSAPGGFEWNAPDDVVEVPDDLGLDLVEIPGAGFEEVPPPAVKDEAPDAADLTEAPAKRGRPRKTTPSDAAEVAE